MLLWLFNWRGFLGLLPSFLGVFLLGLRRFVVRCGGAAPRLASLSFPGSARLGTHLRFTLLLDGCKVAVHNQRPIRLERGYPSVVLLLRICACESIPGSSANHNLIGTCLRRSSGDSHDLLYLLSSPLWFKCMGSELRIRELTQRGVVGKMCVIVAAVVVFHADNHMYHRGRAFHDE